MAKIELKNIDKAFDGKIVLKEISFTVGDGEFISLLGASGSGKSTTLKIIAGIIEPTGGDVLLNQSSCLKMPIEKRGTVIVFQENLLFPHLNLEDNIGFGLKMAKVDKKKRNEKVREIMKLLELEGLEKRYPKEISGGQQQRVAIGRALAVEPKVLLLDEPFSSLDSKLKETLRELILKLQKELKITTILVTHDKEEALMMSERIAVLIDGSIVQYGTPQELYEKPATKAVADFFGEKNYIVGKIEKGMFYSGLLTFATNLEIGVETRGSMMIKPEDLKISKPDLKEQEEGQIQIVGFVKKMVYGGERIYYTVQCGDQEIKSVASSESRFSVGEAVQLVVNTEKTIFYPNKAEEK